MTRSAAIAVLNGGARRPGGRELFGTSRRRCRSDSTTGCRTESAASFDNLRVVPKAYLVDRVCVLDAARLAEACAALSRVELLLTTGLGPLPVASRSRALDPKPTPNENAVRTRH